MSGTGFFDSVALVDTTKDPSEMKKTPVQELPSTSTVAAPPKVINPNPPIDYTSMNEPIDSLIEEVVSEMPLKVVKASTFPSNWTSTGASIVQDARVLAQYTPTCVLAMIAGPAKSGKTGMVLDSLTPEEVANGAEIWHVDFDLGGDTTKAAHHSDKKDNIVIISPWVMVQNQSRVPYDFQATYQRVLDILNHAHEVAKEQAKYFMEHGSMPKPYLKTLVFDGADQWLNICGTLMKVYDLELGRDGIATTGQKTTTKIGRFNWEIRKNRYRAALPHGMQETARLGVHCYVITHMKPSFDSNGNEILGSDVPDILPRSEGDFQQLIHVKVLQERNEKGELTGSSRSQATVLENRTSLKCGQPVVLFIRNAESPQWYGWPGLRDGTFDHGTDLIGYPE
jgi:hypothetical protein